MKLTVPSSQLLEAVALAGQAVHARSPRPDHGAIRLVASGNRLLVESNGGVLSVSHPIDRLRVEAEGKVLVDGGNLKDVARGIASEEVELSFDGKVLRISGQDEEFERFVQDGDLQPMPKLDAPKLRVEIKAAILRRLFELTAFAAGGEFTAVNLSIDGGMAEAAATDGRRLSVARGAIVSAEGDESSVMIPSQAHGLIESILGGDPDDTAVVTRDANYVHVQVGQTSVAALLTEGQFADYQRIIPTDSNRKMTCRAKDLLDAVTRASIFMCKESRIAKFEFRRGKLTITGRSPEVGRATISIPCDYEGKSLEVGFNPAMFADALKAVGDVDVHVEMSADNRPALMRIADDELRYVVMPATLPQ